MLIPVLQFSLFFQTFRVAGSLLDEAIISAASGSFALVLESGLPFFCGHLS